MNGKQAKRIRKALGYKKSPSHLDGGGLWFYDMDELDIVEWQEMELGKEYATFVAQARNDRASQYRAWKRAVGSKLISSELIGHLAHQQGLHPLITQSVPHSTVGNE